MATAFRYGCSASSAIASAVTFAAALAVPPSPSTDTAPQSCGLSPAERMRSEADSGVGAVAGWLTGPAFAVTSTRSSAAAGTTVASRHATWPCVRWKASTFTSQGSGSALPSTAEAADAAGAGAEAASDGDGAGMPSMRPSARRRACTDRPSRSTEAKWSLRASGCTSASPTFSDFQPSSSASAAVATATSSASTEPRRVTLGWPSGAIENAASRSPPSTPRTTFTGSAFGTYTRYGARSKRSRPSLNVPLRVCANGVACAPVSNDAPFSRNARRGSTFTSTWAGRFDRNGSDSCSCLSSCTRPAGRSSNRASPSVTCTL